MWLALAAARLRSGFLPLVDFLPAVALVAISFWPAAIPDRAFGAGPARRAEARTRIGRAPDGSSCSHSRSPPFIPWTGSKTLRLSGISRQGRGP